MRFFNTEGPVRPDDHYGIPPLERMDVEELLGLIHGKRYFVLHAPRQTGKTSALIALRDLLNSGAAGNFRCVNVNVEVGQVARDDTARASVPFWAAWPTAPSCWATTIPPGSGLMSWRTWGRKTLSRGCSPAGAWRTRRRWCCWWTRSTRWWATPCSRCCASSAPAMNSGPEGFPQSVVLCGVRDIRDYRIRVECG